MIPSCSFVPSVYLQNLPIKVLYWQNNITQKIMNCTFNKYSNSGGTTDRENDIEHVDIQKIINKELDKTGLLKKTKQKRCLFKFCFKCVIVEPETVMIKQLFQGDGLHPG